MTFVPRTKGALDGECQSGAESRAAPGNRRVEACHGTRPESSGDSIEVQVAAGDVDATGHRKVDSSCSSNGSSGRVVPEKPGDDL